MRRKRSKKKRRYVEEEELDEAGEEDDAEPAPLRGSDWKLRGPHFVLSAERLTSVLAWSQTRSVERQIVNSFDGSITTRLEEVENSGTDVSLLGAGALSSDRREGFFANYFSVPRVGFDGMLGNGFTFGGSLGYMVTSGERSATDESGGAVEIDTPTVSVLVFAPRLGFFIPTSKTLAIWLRGGVTRLSASIEQNLPDESGGTIKRETTLTFVDITLDPQLVISPVPHIGITLGAALDIGVSGSMESRSGSTSSSEFELIHSSYGVTAGIAAIF